ncbi:MAG: DUF1330 domain-containing protein [Oleiphilus sp.]|nr:MAG: DUF1330 domain-containing protein [Oleiphilus sp.]
MALERLMGLYVSDTEGYKQYRQAMLPLLEEYGGAFGYDFEVSKVLKSKGSNNINRVFTITFPNLATMDEFFNDPRYLRVKEQYFSRSVSEVTTLSLHDEWHDSAS